MAYTINIKGEVRDFSTPWVMGIINVTPDSFYASSRTSDADAICQRLEQMRTAGAVAVDIGGYSSRPGADDVSPQQEYERVALALECVAQVWPTAVVSIDTFRASVAERCLQEWGVDIINDISGGELDPDIINVVASYGCAYVLMHMRGTPATMQSLTDYKDVTADVLADLAAKVARLNALGVRDILLDPGFGFAKTLDQNYTLMAHLEQCKALGLPLFVGISRKSMIYKLLDTTPEQSLTGTTVLNTYALMHGASVLRVHDVEAAVQAVKITQKLKNS